VNLDDGSVTGPGGLLERFAQLPDPRGRRGRRHPLAGLLVIAWAAVLAGARSFAAIGQFSRTLPQATLARLGSWQRPYSTWHVAPSETTLRWVLQRVDTDEVDRFVGGWLAEQAAAGRGPIAVDGKVLRGARQPGGHQVHLFAALAHDSGTVLAQRRVDAQTNETTQLEPLLDEVDLAGRVVTADALSRDPYNASYAEVVCYAEVVGGGAAVGVTVPGRSAYSQAFEEGDDRVWWLVAAWGGAGWDGAGEGLLFEDEVGVEVGLGGGDVVVAEPQGDGGGVHVGAEQPHGRGCAAGRGV